MRFSAFAATLIVPALVLTVGCAKKTVVGKWQGTMEAPMVGSVSATVEYKADGTMTQVASTPMGAVDVAGTYKAEGDKLTITVSDIKAGGKSVMAMLPPQAKSSLSKTVSYKLDGDKLTVTEKGVSQVFTRVKE